MQSHLFLLFLLGCKHIETEPVYSAVPPRVEIVDDGAKQIGLEFRFKQDHEPQVTDIVDSNGWHVVTGLPEVSNYETVSNVWHGVGIESRYESNVVYYRQK